MNSVWGSIVADHERSANVKVNSNNQHKTCIKCEQTKPLTEFYHRSGRSADSFSSRCRECLKQYAREQRAAKKKGV